MRTEKQTDRQTDRQSENHHQGVAMHNFQCASHTSVLLHARRSKRGISYGNVSGWVGGWLAGCLSQPVLYQND